MQLCSECYLPYKPPALLRPTGINIAAAKLNVFTVACVGFIVLSGFLGFFFCFFFCCNGLFICIFLITFEGLDAFVVSSSAEVSSCSNCSSNGGRTDSFYNPNEGFAKGNMQSNIYKPYKLVNPSLPPVSNERERLLLDVQMYSFAMWDLNLYLNTHPTDRNAMSLFDNYRNSYRRAVNEYENKYGSLNLDKVNTNGQTWEWNKSPWPWEV